MNVSVRPLTGDDLVAALPDVARLRITVFRDWPYLYDGDLAYETAYLEPYKTSPSACVVGAFDGERLVGAATGTPMMEHADDFAAAFHGSDHAPPELFYCAESVLLPGYRGRGIGHAFFDHRESHARALGYDYAAFCAVVRPLDHPDRPKGYRPLDAFWRKRGYAPLPGVTAWFTWRDIGAREADDKELQVWLRALNA